MGDLVLNKGDVEYDIVLSLGNQCGVASQLERKGLRVCSGPLDWFSTQDDEAMERLIANRFADFMRLENLEVVGRYAKDDWHDEEYLVVRDNLYNVNCPHDFPCSTNESSLTGYPEFRRRLDRRIGRFLHQVDHLDSILFVRRGGWKREHYANLREILREQRKGKRFHLYAVAYRDAYNNIQGIDNVTPFQELIPCDDNLWLPDEQEWDMILDRLSITEAGRRIDWQRRQF